MVGFLRFRDVLVVGLVVLLAGLWMPMAVALTPIEISDLSYDDCPPSLADGAVVSGSMQSARCFIVTGKAENTSGKMVVNADIFGRIYDANNSNVMPNRTRLGAIEEVPPGVSEFELQIMVPANQPLPLQLRQFKASGFTGRVRR
ncbi:MAG: hypothetical protein JJU32_17755 [Phormidium sp. BM_Day4_Bin.17]|nr:hypothetical protein [Phormidium sp. BM_Day4_Bin.17]UCJ12677.1 MAG: hypothetical protein JWS08_02340 [Phormidium sp. PBR-2020]